MSTICSVYLTDPDGRPVLRLVELTGPVRDACTERSLLKTTGAGPKTGPSVVPPGLRRVFLVIRKHKTIARLTQSSDGPGVDAVACD